MTTAQNDAEHRGSTEPEHHPRDEIVDLLLFAPLGLAVGLREHLPTFVARGRQEMRNARVIGHLAVDRLAPWFDRVAEDPEGELADLVRRVRRAGASADEPDRPDDGSRRAPEGRATDIQREAKEGTVADNSRGTPG